MNSRLLAWPVLLALWAPAQGQSKNVLGRDDAAFARALFDKGYPELAEGLCKAILAGGSTSAADKLAVAALDLELRLEAARGNDDPAVRRDLVSVVLADKEAFIKANSGTEEALIVQQSMPETYAALGTAYTDLLERETDPTKLSELRKEGERIFERAELELQRRIAEIEEALDEAGEDEAEKLSGEDATVRFNLGKTYYYHGGTYPQGEGGYFFDKAVETFQELGLSYDETIFNFLGLIYMGLAHKQLNLPEDAELDFDDAIALREYYEPDEDGRFPMTPDESAIVAWATTEKIRLLRDLGRIEDAVAVADDYMEHTVNPLGTAASPLDNGCRVLALKAECEQKTGNVRGAAASAQRLVDFDPSGPWGNYGREILGNMAVGPGGSDVSASELLKIAASLLDSGSYEKGRALCLKAIQAARGKADEADIGSRAMLMIGTSFDALGWLNEASAAYDSSWQSYPNGKSAVDGLYWALKTYQRLASKEKRKFYRDRQSERGALLAERYADHPLATEAILIRGQEDEDAGEFQKAADFYASIQTSSPIYATARFKAGRCVYELARKQSGAQAEPGYEKALAYLREARQAASAAMQRTIDVVQQRKLAGVDFDALGLQARIELKRGRASEVMELLDQAEEQYSGDAANMGQIYGLRVQTLNELDRIDEAVAMLEGLLLKDKNAPGVATACGELARSLDARAIKALEAGDPAVDELWSKAGRYYVEQTRQLVESGRITPLVATQTADRLLYIGMHLNGVPADQTSFLGFTPARDADLALWEEAATLYEAALAQVPSYLASVSLARCYGFLGLWSEGATTLAALFDQEKVYDRTAKKFDNAQLAAKRELFLAYLEYGALEHRAGVESQDKARLRRAGDIVDAVSKATTAAGANAMMFWWSNFLLIRNSFDLGEYENADLLMRQLERSQNDGFDQGKYGLKPLFEALKKEIAPKIRR